MLQKTWNTTEFGKTSKDEQLNAAQKQIERQDASKQNAVEGKFGEGKRRYKLTLISAHLRQTPLSICSAEIVHYYN